MPVEEQDAACVWFWKAMDYNTILYLSKGEILKGTWAWLTPSFGPQRKDWLLSMLPYDGLEHQKLGSCAVGAEVAA